MSSPICAAPNPTLSIKFFQATTQKGPNTCGFQVPTANGPHKHNQSAKL